MDGGMLPLNSLRPSHMLMPFQTSVTLLLGLNTIDLIFRTTVPAVGLFVLVGEYLFLH